MSKKLVLVLLLFLPFLTIAQDPYSVNTDSLLSMAQQDYRNGQFQKSLDLTRRGLSIAPDYHDIRILQIRNLWALGNFPAADKDLFLLLDTSPTYPDLKPLAMRCPISKSLKLFILQIFPYR
jgi:tetratricopeptide (TPR) repeat protein